MHLPIFYGLDNYKNSYLTKTHGLGPYHQHNYFI